MKYLFAIAILFKGLSVFAQTESVHLHLDKSIVYPEDTVWFSAYVFDENHISKRSTNLYVELYDNEGKLQLRNFFPIANGVSYGQVPMPEIAGLYWIRTYTRNSGFFISSLTVRGKDKKLVTRSMINNREKPVVTDILGLVISSVCSSQGASVSAIPDVKSTLYGKKIKLLIQNYSDTIAVKELVLQRDHQLHYDIPIGDMKGFLTLQFYVENVPVARQEIRIPQKQVPVNVSLDNGKCTINISDAQPCNYSLAIVNSNAAGEAPSILNALSPVGEKKPVDENGLIYSGRLNLDMKDPSTKIPDMTVMLQDKNVKGQASIIKLDETRRFSISGLAFQDTATLFYSLNENSLASGNRVSDFNIQLDPIVFPVFKAPEPGTYRLDTISLAATDKFINTPHLLEDVKVKGKKIRSEKNKDLDKDYTTGKFRWPARFNYNLMDTSHYSPKYLTNILLYLNHELPTFKYDVMDKSTPPAYKSKYITFYLDEQLVNYKQLLAVPITDLAYVKVIEDFADDDKNTRAKSDIPDNTGHAITKTVTADFGTDNSPGAMIIIYRRKGKDLQNTASDNMKILPLIGYNKSVKWTMPDRSTLLWTPFVHDKNYTFSLPKDALNGSYKIILEGEDADGEVFHFEQALK